MSKCGGIINGLELRRGRNGKRNRWKQEEVRDLIGGLDHRAEEVNNQRGLGRGSRNYRGCYPWTQGGGEHERKEVSGAKFGNDDRTRSKDSRRAGMNLQYEGKDGDEE